MQLDPKTATVREIYSTMIRAIAPRPIAWVSTISPNGIANLAPFSFFNGICSKPAALMFSPVNQPDGSKKDTVVNIEATGQFVVNVVPFHLAEPMLESSAELDYEVNEFEASNIAQSPSVKVKPPQVAQSPIHFECELLQIVNIGEGPFAANVIIGEIVLLDINDDVLNDAGKIDPNRVDAIGRMGGISYCRTDNLFEIKR